MAKTDDPTLVLASRPTSSIHLASVDTTAFAAFLKWLYTQEIIPFEIKGSDWATFDAWLNRTISLYESAVELDAEGLGNHIMTALILTQSVNVGGFRPFLPTVLRAYGIFSR